MAAQVGALPIMEPVADGRQHLGGPKISGKDDQRIQHVAARALGRDLRPSRVGLAHAQPLQARHHVIAVGVTLDHARLKGIEPRGAAGQWDISTGMETLLSRVLVAPPNMASERGEWT